MAAFYKIDKERKLVMTTASGVLTMAEALGTRKNFIKTRILRRAFLSCLT